MGKKKQTTSPFSTGNALEMLTVNGLLELQYAEEATFSCDGDWLIRKGGRIEVGKGVASRWQGVWFILESTHTIDSKGYTIDGKVARAPYDPDDDEKFKKQLKKKKKKNKTVVKMDSQGNWRKVK